jgi:hypothetical protein
MLAAAADDAANTHVCGDRTSDAIKTNIAVIHSLPQACHTTVTSSFEGA